MNFDFWAQEWPLIAGAPHIAIGGVVVIAAAVFAFMKLIYSGQIAALNERRRLAEDRQKDLTWHIEKLKVEMAALTQQIEQKAALPLLASSTAKVTGSIGELSTLSQDAIDALNNAWYPTTRRSPTNRATNASTNR